MVKNGLKIGPIKKKTCQMLKTEMNVKQNTTFLWLNTFSIKFKRFWEVSCRSNLAQRWFSVRLYSSARSSPWSYLSQPNQATWLLSFAASWPAWLMGRSGRLVRLYGRIGLHRTREADWPVWRMPAHKSATWLLYPLAVTCAWTASVEAGRPSFTFSVSWALCGAYRGWSLRPSRPRTIDSLATRSESTSWRIPRRPWPTLAKW